MAGLLKLTLQEYSQVAGGRPPCSQANRAQESPDKPWVPDTQALLFLAFGVLETRGGTLEHCHTRAPLTLQPHLSLSL